MPEELTQRELEIYKYLLQPLDYNSIADKACMSMGTLRTHLIHIFLKTMVNSRHELMARRIKELENEVRNLKGKVV